MSMNWIVNGKYDLFFFSGSILGSFLLYFVYLFLSLASPLTESQASTVVFFLFSSLVDTPHLLYTFSRTHFDKTEFFRHHFIHSRMLMILMVAGILLVGRLEEDHVFFTGLGVLGIWHVMKQNWGFIKAYKILNGDNKKNWEDLLDKALFYGAAVSFAATAWKKEWARELGKFLPFLFLLYLAVQVGLWWKRKEVNIPKFIFSLSIYPATFFIYLKFNLPFLLTTVLCSTYHGIQYFGWCIHFQKRRLCFSPQRVGSFLAGTLVNGILISSVLYLTHWKLLPVYAMFILYHYWVDGLIWKFGKGPELRTVLG